MRYYLQLFLTIAIITPILFYIVAEMFVIGGFDRLVENIEQQREFFTEVNKHRDANGILRGTELLTDDGLLYVIINLEKYDQTCVHVPNVPGKLQCYPNDLIAEMVKEIPR